MTILALGSVALDTTRTPFRTVENVLGGSLSFFALAAQFFHPVAALSAVGPDFPQSYRDFLSKWDIDWSALQTVNAPTFHFDSEFDESLYHRKALKTVLGAEKLFKPTLTPALQKAEYAYLGTYVPEHQIAVLNAFKKRPKLVFADTIEFFIENNAQDVDTLFSLVDGIVINDSEARLYSGESNLVKAAYAIQEAGPRIVIIKKGEHGCLVFNGDSMFPFPGYPLENVVDPTGAGDSFAGGLMGYLANAQVQIKPVKPAVNKRGRRGKTGFDDATLRRAVAYGTVMGSFCVEDFSLNRLANLTKSDIDGRYTALKNLTTF